MQTDGGGRRNLLAPFISDLAARSSAADGRTWLAAQRFKPRKVPEHGEILRIYRKRSGSRKINTQTQPES